MAVKTTKWDVAEFLASPDDVRAYLDAALEENDPVFFQKALGDAARSKGMAEIARATGAGRESLYKSLSERGNPSFSTVFGVLEALNLRFSIVSKSADNPANDDQADSQKLAKS